MRSTSWTFPTTFQRKSGKSLDTSYAEEDYAIGMAKNSPLEDAVNSVLEELKALDRDPDDTKFSEYMDGAWFTDTWLTEN